ncbi:hypothetical protein TRFO_37926 [Tritrichomonas foetus]|uniref:Uncharacterized protein n=1 Tax=Tritrichomonas foetus TaxID=1144522 RepID=A0A1J4J9R4_9EUKA|nr:hypothetical protein TRFO_37926 [Tritrichomonas foetus]|eukprot:OHS95934.1 hypothetical protein TRFO_37926 [Tritrichomonas foetus]
MSISSTVVSFFSYFQNIGCTITLPSLDIPPEMMKILNAVRNFLATIQDLFPQLPQFDIRAQLIIIAVAIPLVLDIVFVWFVQKLSSILLHIFDIICIAGFAFCLANGVLGGFTAYTYALVPVTGLYILVRIIYKSCKSKSGTFGLVQIANCVCGHFLYGILPNIQNELSINDLNKIIGSYSEVVQIKEKKASACGTFTFFIISAICIVITLFCEGIGFELGNYLSPIFLRALESLAIIFAFLFMLIFFLRLFACGRRIILWFKQFCKRWGLRLLMLALDLLYIPILTLLVSNVMVTKSNSCPVGQYLYVVPSSSNKLISAFLNRKSVCVPCNYSYSSLTYTECREACSGKQEYRLQDDPSLRFYEDVFRANISFILYTVFVVMFGIPILWYSIIQRNKTYAYCVNVYGTCPSDKWLRLVNRMKTTGIFLFVNYKFNSSAWSVFYLFVKFSVMIITTIAGRIYSTLTYVLPVFYLIVFILICKVRPYLYQFNNILDGILYLTQILFSLVPVLAVFGITIPDSASVPLSIIITVVPVVSIIFLLFCKRKHVDFEHDPTFVQVLDEEEEEALEKKRAKAKRRKRREIHEMKERIQLAKTRTRSKGSFMSSQSQFSSSSSFDPFVIDQNLTTIPEEVSSAEEIEADEEVLDNFLTQLDANENICLIPEDEYEVKPGDLDCMKDCIASRCTKKGYNKVEPIDGGTFIVNKRVLANRMTSMYEMLDIVVDGATIEFLTKALNLGIMLAVAAFGWYFGAITLSDDYLVCHHY